jgi:uncharacterized membrane protein
MKQLLKVVVIILTIGYPFMVYWGLQHYSAAKLLPLLLALLALRWLVGNRPGERPVLIAILAIVLTVAFTWGHQIGLKFYPALVNLGLLVLFAGSLLSPPSFVERLARLREPDLSPAGVIYTRRVTLVWCIFFIVNGSVAAATALWASNEIWVLYNGFIAYLLIGTLTAGEWLVRQRVMH